MRLLNTDTLELETFSGDLPTYAILSHTWSEQEVTFKDIFNPSRTELKGWAKISGCCRRAARDKWRYCWIDTCCIDKSDPTELSEAINSMFKWYQRAQICYVFLADVPSRSEFQAPDYTVSDCPWNWHFRSSRWFTRGWTLQELLAPDYLLFLDSEWNSIGYREDYAAEIELATGINAEQLSNFESCSVATKLSWAANRRTTREEDRSYSLLGLVGINMPLLYGEGHRAFHRLQQELIRNYNDETIFAWSPCSEIRKSVKITQGLYHGGGKGVLADYLQDFQDANDLERKVFDEGRVYYSMNNAGLNLNAEVFERQNKFGGPTGYSIKLNCSSSKLLDRGKPVYMILRSIDSALSTFERIKISRWTEYNWSDWISRGRRDIIVSSPRNASATKTSPTLRAGFSLTSHFQLRRISELPRDFTMIHPTIKSLDSWEISDCQIPLIVRPEELGLVEMVFNLSGDPRNEIFFILLHLGSRKPSISIWGEADFGKSEGFQIASYINNALKTPLPLDPQTPEYRKRYNEMLRLIQSRTKSALEMTYQTSAKTHSGQIIHVSINPVSLGDPGPHDEYYRDYGIKFKLRPPDQPRVGPTVIEVQSNKVGRTLKPGSSKVAPRQSPR
jgi:hypothetical protein